MIKKKDWVRAVLISVTQSREQHSHINSYLEYKLVQPFGSTIQQFLLKFKVHIPFTLAISLLGIYSKGKVRMANTYQALTMFQVLL